MENLIDSKIITIRNKQYDLRFLESVKTISEAAIKVLDENFEELFWHPINQYVLRFYSGDELKLFDTERYRRSVLNQIIKNNNNFIDAINVHTGFVVDKTKEANIYNSPI